VREKLLKATVRDVKNVRLAVIEPKGAVHEIRGDAGNGKTTILQALQAAFEGLDPKCVREGADRAEIELVLSSLQIRRVVDREGKEQLTVVEGNKPISKKNVAQGLLEALWGKAFDPIAWVNLGRDIGKGTTENRRAQRDQLVAALDMLVTREEIEEAVNAFEGGDEFKKLNLEGIDWEQHAYVVLSELLKRAGQVYHDTINYEKKNAESVLSVTPAPETRPECSLEELQAALEDARAQFYGAEQAQKSRSGLVDQVNRLRQAIEAGKTKLMNPKTGKPLDRATLDKGIAGRLSELTEVQSGIVTRDKEIADLEAALTEVREERERLRSAERELTGAISKYETMQSELSAQEARVADLARLEAELAGDGIVCDTGSLREDIETLEAAIADIEQGVKHDAAAEECVRAVAVETLWRESLLPLLRDGMLNLKLARMRLPVEGVRIEDDQITVHGRPLWTLGTSEQYVVGVKLGALLNKRLGFMPIDRGESIGTKELENIYAAFEELDVTGVITFMDPAGTPSEHCTVMVDGAPVASKPVETVTAPAATPVTPAAPAKPRANVAGLVRARKAQGVAQ
jgi:hypothetical protein